MAASIAAAAIPIAAAGAFAARTVGSALGSFSSFITQASDRSKDSADKPNDASRALADRIEQFQKQLASRIRNSGHVTEQRVEVQLDEFGLLRAYSQGQENIDLSRWLAGETDLAQAFADLQAQSTHLGNAAKLTMQVDLASAPAF